jgi:hypothetical protein
MSFISFPFIIFLLLASTVIGTSFSLVLGLGSSDFSWLLYHRLSISLVAVFAPLVGMWFTGSNSLTLLLLLFTGLTFLYAIYLNNNMGVIVIIICHYLCSVAFCFTIILFDLSIALLGCLLLLDVLSVLQVCMVPGTTDRIGCWSYLLYQACLTLVTWFCLCYNLSFLVCFFWFMKLGGGFTGFYLPTLYRALSGCDGILMYIGAVTIFQSWCSYLLLSAYFKLGFVDLSIKYGVVVVVLLSMFIVILNWCYNIDWLVTISLYGLCISTMLTVGSLSLILFLGSTSLFTKTIIGSFLLMSQLSWCILLLCVSVN